MNLQPTLKHELVLVRPLISDDFSPLYEVAKDPLIWEQHPCSGRYKKDEFSDFFKDSLDSGGALVVIDKFKNCVIGSSRFKQIPNAENALEIGWSFLSRDYWGGLYNKAVKKLMIDYAFESMEFIVFYIGKNNIRSQKAVEKIGGKKISTPEFRHFIRDEENELTYLIRKNDWAQT